MAGDTKTVDSLVEKPATLARLRDETRFESAKDLAEQIARDVERTREVVGTGWSASETAAAQAPP